MTMTTTLCDNRVGYSAGMIIEVPAEGELLVGEFVKLNENGMVTKWDEKVDKNKAIGRVVQTSTSGHTRIILDKTLYEVDTREDAEENRIIKKGW